MEKLKKKTNMKTFIIIFLVLFLTNFAYGQEIDSTKNDIGFGFEISNHINIAGYKTDINSTGNISLGLLLKIKRSYLLISGSSGFNGVYRAAAATNKTDYKINGVISEIGYKINKSPRFHFNLSLIFEYNFYKDENVTDPYFFISNFSYEHYIINFYSGYSLKYYLIKQDLYITQGLYIGYGYTNITYDYDDNYTPTYTTGDDGLIIKNKLGLGYEF
ncbi:MAG: hypothetical protein Kow0068_15930 [Marinilabiliales bacterium]